MTLTLELAPALEQELIARSSQAGLPTEQFTMELLKSVLGVAKSVADPEAKVRLKTEEWQREFDEFGVASGVSLSDEALSSEGLYE